MKSISHKIFRSDRSENEKRRTAADLRVGVGGSSRGEVGLRWQLNPSIASTRSSPDMGRPQRPK
jgi:hypothetical protein